MCAPVGGWEAGGTTPAFRLKIISYRMCERWDENNRKKHPKVWSVLEKYGFDSTICSVEGCCRDNLAFMWVRSGRLDLDELAIRPGLRGGENRLEELRGELSKCIFHTDKENELWISNWGREHEEWKMERDDVLREIRKEQRRFPPNTERLQQLGVRLRKIVRQRPEYNWRDDEVREFWRLIREYRDVEQNLQDERGRWGIRRGNSYDFSRFNFPEFERVEDHIAQQDSESYFVSRNDVNFWNAGERTGFERSANFEKATFLGDVAFGIAVFSGNTNFREATFSRNSNFLMATFSGYANFWGAIFLGNANFEGIRFSEDTNFEIATFLRNTNFHEAEFLGDVNFLIARFLGDANFLITKFLGNANFEIATFLRNANFGEATFSGDANFEGIRFSGDANFVKVKFSENANFWEGVFSKDTYFWEATFLGDVNFGKVTFSGNASFWRATFSGNANFWEATFSGNANFWEAIFLGNTDFWRVTFSGNANFREVTFSGNACFRRAIFSGYTYFNETTFSGNANFREVTFSGNTNFDGAKFLRYAYFVKSTFSGNTNFKKVIFSRYANFGKVTFSRNANFWKATFSEDAYFWKVTFSGIADFTGEAEFGGDANFSNAIFKSGANFSNRIFKGESKFQYATFSGITLFHNTTFNGLFDLTGVRLLPSTQRLQGNITPPPNEEQNRSWALEIEENRGAGGGRLELVGVRFGENGEFILSDIPNLNLSNFYIYDLDLSKAKRIEFQRVPLEDLKFTNVRWGNISTDRISPELYRKSPTEARDIYRQLKLALDKQENYIDARGFYALELQAHGKELEEDLEPIVCDLAKFLDTPYKFAEIVAFLGILQVLVNLLFKNLELLPPLWITSVVLIILISISLLEAVCKFKEDLLSWFATLTYGILITLAFLLLPVLFNSLLSWVWIVKQYGFTVLAFVVITTLIPWIFLISLIFWIRQKTKSIQNNHLNQIMIYRFYDLTAKFGLSWLRPLLGLFITVALIHALLVYPWKDLRFPQWLDLYNEPYKIFNKFRGLIIDTQGYSQEAPRILTFPLFVMSGYFLYQFILALRRQVRR